LTTTARHTSSGLRNRLADLPIRVKFTLVSVIITLAGLAIAAGVFLVHERQRAREELLRETLVLARVMGNNTTAALTFRDRDTANDILSAARGAAGVRSVALYDANRRLFASYRASAGCPLPSWEETAPDTHAFRGPVLCLSYTIRLDNENIGYLAICTGTETLRQRLARSAGLAGLVLLVSLLAAIALSWHLQQRVAKPILELAQAAGEVTGNQAYTQVIPPAGNDEIGVLVSNFNTMIERIRTREEALRANARILEDYQERLRSMAAELVAAEERERRALAEALHDSVCQTLAVAKLQVECLLGKEDPSTDRAAPLTRSRDLLMQAIVEARGLIGQLSPRVLYDVGLDAALDHLADQIEDRYGLNVRVQNDDGDDTPIVDDLRVLIYRAVQELLMNVVKHAGATQAEVTLRRRDGRMEVAVADNGSGFQRPAAHLTPNERGGFGLFSIRERVRYVGGELTVDSSPGQGARIRMVVPLPLPADGDAAQPPAPGSGATTPAR